MIKKTISNPEKPFVLIVGGAKADKIGAISNLLHMVDHVIVGGVLANTFLKECIIRFDLTDINGFIISLNRLLIVSGNEVTIS